jgi:hypothetical protein
MKKLFAVVTMLSLVITGEALAKDINFITGTVQSEFKDISKGLGAALSYKNTAPAAPLGITGFDIGVESAFMSVDSDYWDKAFNNNAPSFIPIPKVRVRKGLPLGIDIGAMYSYLPDSNIRLYGAEVGYAILEGGVASPAVGVRGTYTKLTGVDQLDFQTAGVDASVSKGFLILTPYAGAGMLYVDSKGKKEIAALKEEKIWLPRYFVGAKLSPFPLFGITAEAEYSSRPVYSLRVALSF